MERWVKRTIEFGAGLVFLNKQNPSVIPYYPQKTEVSGEEEKYFHRTSPEKKGVSSGRITALIKAIEKEKRANIHTMIIIKDGEIISEFSHPGYDTNIWHLAYSMSKSVTGILIGMLVDDGLLKLDTPIYKIFPEVQYRQSDFEKITVRHLITMTAGIRFSEAGSLTETKWTESFFDSTLAYIPGTEFMYNSMNSYILARIVERVSGKSFYEFSSERLFAPLHIKNYFWEKSAEGTEKGGWGLFMSAESWAKLGQMMLDRGVFEGKRIVSEEWVRESTSVKAETTETTGHYDYGYHIWADKESDAFLFNGMLGQNVWVCPKNRIVAVFLSGNNELFQNSPTLALVESYLGIDLENDISDSCFSGDTSDLHIAEKNFFVSRHWIRPATEKKGISYRLGLKHKTPYPEEWEMLFGKYHFVKNGYGIVPLLCRGMQNNFKSSIDGVAFERDGDEVYFIYKEGGSTYRFEIGFYDFKETVIDLRGEKYIVKVIGEAMEDEDRNMVFKLELLFPEIPNTRMIKFTLPEDDMLLMRMSEMPSDKIVGVYLDEIAAANPRIGFFKDMIDKRLGNTFADRRLHETFFPTLVGAKKGSERYTEILDLQRAKLKAQEKNNRIVDAIIDKLLHDDDIDGIDDRGFFGELLDIIKSRMPKKKN